MIAGKKNYKYEYVHIFFMKKNNAPPVLFRNKNNKRDFFLAFTFYL